MEPLTDVPSRAVDELLGRASGPLHARLLTQPIVATIFAVRSGLRDAREDGPAFLWTIVTDSVREFVRSGWKHISKLFVLAVVLYAICQGSVLQRFLIVQALIAAIVITFIPYCILRGPGKHIPDLLHRRQETVA